MRETVHAAFAATAARTPGAAFLFTESVTARAYGIPAGSVAWAEAAARVSDLRSAYEAAGYGHGHRVGLLLDNRPDFLFHWFALNALGVSVVPIHSEMRSAELAYLIGHSEIGLAICLAPRRADLQAAAAQAGIAFETADAQLTGGVPPARGPATHGGGDPIGPGTECALLYTSGTTGRP
ncbi:MAG: AMP-binding protein, partial [Lautropia sp.]|nr:AMP-binding protein [Lautropia sp.]